MTSALDNTVVVSGGEDSRIIITSLKTKEVLTKIDHHRGPVTAVQTTPSGDILISGKNIEPATDYQFCRACTDPSALTLQA